MFEKRNQSARKLTWNQVDELRRRYHAQETQSSLSRAFGISVGQVGRIVRGESWQEDPYALAKRMAPVVMTKELEAEMFERLIKLQEQQPVAVQPSILDGGEPPEETQGAGITELMNKAKELGAS